jgi:hypothetical protein
MDSAEQQQNRIVSTAALVTFFTLVSLNIRFRLCKPFLLILNDI